MFKWTIRFYKSKVSHNSRQNKFRRIAYNLKITLATDYLFFQGLATVVQNKLIMAMQQMIRTIASSSNCSSTVCAKKYDVFLSFRGEDTRRNFTSHLHAALMQKKVETYIDNRLEKGDEISPTLIKAIEDSHVSIVILSENYASSKWCLGELNKIVECKKDKGQIVIPIFYNTDPSHVRKHSGSYEQSFAKYEREPRCNIWKAALTEVANLVGWDSRAYRNEAEFIRDIVEDVLQKLSTRYPNQRKGLVGIEESYEQIVSLLKIGSSEVKTIGIWGMGGIGKTTLATALYDNLSYEFDGRCFLANVREKSDKLEALRDELFCKLLNDKSHGFDNFDMSRLRRKKVFIVLDDVATSEQLEKLIVEYDFMGIGSRVIVTTRNMQILNTVDEIYTVQDLSSHHSLQLFCLTVFGEEQPRDGYEDLSMRVISYCKGIPLALKVLGASLRKRSRESWESELRKLQKIPNMEIHNVLKLSYDGLDRTEKDIFLDMACFFKGHDIDWAMGLLEACDFFEASGVEVLLDKALITISSCNCIEMHDLIQEMGREIVHQESIKDSGRRSRLWKHEEVHDVLKYSRGTGAVEGIVLDLGKLTQDLCLSSDSFAKMTNLRFLQIHGGDQNNNFNVFLPSGLESLSDKLRYLHWYRCCLESLPSNFCAEHLVELRMPRSKLKKLWDGIQNLVNLNKIDLYGSQELIEIPDLSKAEQLESVCLAYCESLHQFHPSNSSFPTLAYLDLRGCRKIESIIVHSKSLCKLDIIGCSSLKEISMTSEEITELDLSHYREIESLNLHLKYLSGELDLSGCSFLKEISVKSEKMLQLNLSRTSICSLPASIKNLSRLRWLHLTDCRKLVSLPELPPTLEELYLNGCRKLMSLSELPPSLGALYLNNCWKLKSLPALPPSLEDVIAINCTSLDTDNTQQLVLQHMLQNHINYLHKKYLNYAEYFDSAYFIFPGDHISSEYCRFHTTDSESSITIPYLPKSHLLGFIYCTILSKELLLEHYVMCCCSIFQDGIKVGWDSKGIFPSNLISNHVLFWYHDLNKFDKISEVNEHFSNITFLFEFSKESIKGCGVFPVYATMSGLKLVSSSSRENFEWQSISQIYGNESQPREISVGFEGFNNENEDDREQLPATKRKRTLHK